MEERRMNEKIVLTKLKCKRCEYEWNPRIPNLPKCCPRCKNPNWNKVNSKNIRRR